MSSVKSSTGNKSVIIDRHAEFMRFRRVTKSNTLTKIE